ncbi:MAG: hypothetical protein KF753_19020 [Caldilineaceae bacterium]|nr:hypothetical protein [Caldilineaceae bacterium]
MTVKRMKVKELWRGQAIQILAAIALVLGVVLAVGSTPVVLAAETTWNVDPDSTGACTVGDPNCATIQAAIDAASDGDTINVAAGTYDEEITIGIEGLTLQGSNGAQINVALTKTGITINASGVTVSGFTIVGPHSANYTDVVWASGTSSTGISVLGANATVSGNVIRNVRTGILLNTVSSNANVTANTIDNTKGSIIEYGSSVVSGNAPGTIGNEWDIVILTSLYPSNPANVPSYVPASSTLLPLQSDGLSAYGQAMMALSQNNGAMKILDRRFPNSNVSHVFVQAGSTPTPAEDFGVGNGLGNLRQPLGGIQHGITAVAPGGIIAVLLGTYTENVNVNKSVTLNGANVGINPNTGSRIGESILNGSVTVSSDDVTFDGFTVSNPSGTAGVSFSSVGGAKVRNSIFNGIGTGNANGSAQAIYISTNNSSVSNFMISDNKIMNVGNTGMLHNGNAGSSAKGIYVGNSGGTGDISNVTITGNNISGIYAATVPWVSGGGGGAGAYGVLINHIASNAKIVNNTISQLEALWAHGIGLEANTPIAVVQGNDISNLTDHKSPSDAIAVFFESNTSASTAIVQFNTFNSVAVGVAAVASSTPIKATNNFWGANSGPSGGFTTPAGCTKPGTSSGSGSIAGPNVCFVPFVGDAPQEVTSSAVSGSGSVNLPGGEVSTAFTGSSATITLAKYTGNPSTVGTFGNAGNYYDINVSGATTGDSLAITLDAGGNTGSLYYYDGDDWKLVKAPDTITPDNDGFYRFTLNDVNTTPRLSELDGTPFGGLSPVVWAELAPGFNSATFGEGETVEVVVKAGSSALYGVDLSLKYGAGLEVTKVSLGGTSTGANLYADAVTYNNNDTGSGELRFAFAQRGDVVGHADNVDDDSIALATITFLAKIGGTGSQTVSLNATTKPLLFSDKNGNPATPTPGADLVLTVIPSPDVYVNVSLQGRNSNWDGTYLKLSPLTNESGNVLYDNQDNSGRLEIDPVPANSNPPSDKTYNVRLDAPKYLAAIRTVLVRPGTDDSIDLTSVELRGGDINGDDKINIQDLVMIGVRFGKVSTDLDWATVGDLANINGDSTVNIQDLAIAAGNFGLETGSTYTSPWQ